MAGMLNENAALRLGLAEKLAGMLDPGHLALTRMSDRLVALRQQVNPRLPQPPGLLQQYEELSAHFNQRAAYKESARAAVLRFRRVSTASKFYPLASRAV